MAGITMSPQFRESPETMKRQVSGENGTDDELFGLSLPVDWARIAPLRRMTEKKQLMSRAMNFLSRRPQSRRKYNPVLHIPRKLATSLFPASVNTLSGWNCTPSIA
jgi:hypothetical protein